MKHHADSPDSKNDADAKNVANDIALVVQDAASTGRPAVPEKIYEYSKKQSRTSRCIIRGMIYHVLPGDAQVEEFREAGIEGEVIVFREALVTGPLDGDIFGSFWDSRAAFILTEYGEDPIEYQDKVANEILKIADVEDEDEVNLWFEYELFCGVNMWFCCELLRNSGARVYRIEPAVLDQDNIWDGFGKMEADDLNACHQQRFVMSADNIELGSDLFRAYRDGDNDRLIELGRTESAAFPHLRVVAAAAAQRDTLPLETVREIVESGKTELTDVFPEFKKRLGVYGYGDKQVERLLDQVLSGSLSD
ncbi:MAG TPA: DUF1835 domain-containing protein [Pyrinomonadaceae bacterium]|nr:DUF1835 domain-containing protein [Pyrinomonadaceae bacterium]